MELYAGVLDKEIYVSGLGLRCYGKSRAFTRSAFGIDLVYRNYF